MSEFKVKVTADLDTSQLESKLNDLQNKKATIQANVKGDGISNLNNQMQQVQNKANDLSASFKGIASAKIKVDALNFLKQQTESAVQSVTDLNQAMTLVSMTMSNMSNSSLNSLKQQSLDLAKDLSTYTKNVTDAITIYANENESVSSMLAKAQPTVLLSAASGMKASSSADAIQGILNQFDLSEDQAMHVADTVEKLSSEIALDFSKGCDTISQSIATSGSVVNEAGMSFEKYAALVSTTAETTRQSGSQIGNAFKTIFSRISRSKDGQTTDAEKSNAEKAFNSVGVSVRGVDGDLRDVSDTLDDLNKVWGTLNKSQKSYVAEQAAGVRQKNIFVAAMNNYNKALQLEQDALDSDGTAMEINDKRADSINGRIEKLSATMTKLYSDALPEDAIEGILDFATAIAQVVDNLGLFQGALSSLGVIGGAKIISTIASNWTGLLSALTSPVGIASLATGGAVAAITAYKQSVQEMMESAKQAGSEWEESQTNLQGQIDKITELREALSEGTLTEQEAADAKSELLSIQESLSDSYGDQVEGIDLINGSLQQQIDLLDKVSQKESENFLNENKKGIDKATKEMEKNRHTYAGRFYDDGSDEAEAIKTSIKKLQDTYGEEVVKLDKSSDGITTDIHINADATQAKEVLNDFMTEISGIEDTYGESDMTDLMLSNASAGLSEANDVLEEYQSLYEQAQKAEMKSDKTLFSADGKDQTAAKWLSDYAKAVQEYNDAVSDGDDTKIKEAATSFNTLDSTMQELSKGSMSEYADQIQEVRDQLNETAIANDKFTKAVKGSDSSDFGKTVSESAKALKDLNLTDTDFKYAFETDGIQEGEDAVNSLVDAAVECGVISDTSSEQVGNLVNMLVQLGVISSSTGSNLDGVADSASDLVTQIENANSALSGIEKATSLLDSQSTGKSISLDDFNSDELADYTSALEYNNGALQLNEEKVRELQKAKADEAIQTNENQKLEKQSQYMENIAQIEKLQEELRGLSDAKSDNAQSIQDNINALLSENDGIVNQCNQLDLLSASLREATGAYQNWLDKQNASESGDMFDDAMGALQHIEDTTQNTDSDYYGRTGRKDYKAAVDFIVPDTIDHEDESAVSSYIDSIEHYFNHDSEGNRTGLDVAEFCAKASKAGLMELDEASGEYKVAGQKTMQDFADGLNLSMPFLESIFGEMEEFNGVFDWQDEAIKTMGDLGMAAGEAKSRIEEASGDTGMNIQIDVSDIENTEDKIATLDSTIQQMQDYKGTVDVDSSQVDDANAVIQYCVAQKQQLTEPAVMSVDASQVDGEIGNAISLLQQFQQAQNNVELQAAVGADTSEAQGQVDSLVSEIQGLSPEIQAKLNIDSTSADTIASSLEGLSPEVMVKAGIDSSLVDSYSPDDKDATVKYDTDTSKPDGYQPDDKSATVTYGVDHSLVDAYNPSNLSREVVYNVVTRGTPPSGGTNSVNGTAHANGTAHYKHITGRAYADGNWSTKTGGTTLVGELGREIVVDPSTGKWHTVGDNGAEFTNIPAGAIVFNHRQSEALLERGFVAGRGKAMAGGSAMVTGGIPVKQANIASGKATYSGSKSSGKSSGDSAKATKADTKATKDHTKSTKKSTSAFDYVARKLTYFANKTKEIADKINDYVSSAFKTSQLQKQISAIGNEIKVNSKGADAYLKKANSIGLSAKVKKDVREGKYSITEYNTSTSSKKSGTKTEYEKIQEYAKYYDEYVKCTQAVQDLKNQQLELFEQWANMPTEAAEKKIEKLKNGFNGLTAIQARLKTASLGGSAQAYLNDTMKSSVSSSKNTRDTAKSNLDKANNRLASANKSYSTAKNSESKATKAEKKEGKKLLSNKSITLTDSEKRKVASGKTINTKGLTGKKKAAVKKYNASVKKANAAKSNTKKAKDKVTSAKKNVSNARSTYNSANSVYQSYVTQYDTASKYLNSGDTLGYQNYLTDMELQNTKEQNKANQEAYSQASKNTQDTIAKRDAAAKSVKTAKTNQSNAKAKGASLAKKYSKKLSKSQIAALNAGKSVNTKGIKDKNLKKKLDAYNKSLTNTANALKNAQSQYEQLDREVEIAQNAEAQAAATAAESQAELAQSAIEAEQTKFENVSNYYDKRLDYQKALAEKEEKAREFSEAHGDYTKSSDYDSEISNEENQRDLAQKKVDALKKQLADAMSSGTIKQGSEEWLEMSSKISEAESAVKDFDTDIENLKQKQITTKYEEMFDRAIEKADKLISKIDTINDLLTEEMMYDYDTGQLTDMGALSLTLNAQSMNDSLSTLQNYVKKRQQIIDDYNNKLFGEKTYDDLMSENDSNIQNALKNANSYKQQILSIVKTQSQKEQDALFKVIDARKDALKKKKEYWDYDKQLKNKTKEINLLQQQIDALDGVKYCPTIYLIAGNSPQPYLATA